MADDKKTPPLTIVGISNDGLLVNKSPELVDDMKGQATEDSARLDWMHNYLRMALLEREPGQTVLLRVYYNQESGYSINVADYSESLRGAIDNARRQTKEG